MLIYIILFFFILSIIILYRYIKYQNKNRKNIPFPTVSTHLKSLKQTNSFKIHIPFILKFIILNLFIVALMRPQYFSNNELMKVQGINIIIALDISDSMKAQDLKPNRLIVAKEVIKEFIQKRPYDRIGLIAYAGDAYIQSPFTIDHSVVLNALRQTNFNNDIEKGTAIGNALALAVDRLKKRIDETKVVILVSDGSNNSGEINPEIAADIASAHTVKVYTIGIGKPGYSLVPITFEDANGRKITQTLPMEMNEPVLKEIALKTGGIYFNAQSTKTLKAIYEKINQYEKTDIEHYSNMKAKELFPFILMIIGLLFLFEIIASQTFLRIIP